MTRASLFLTVIVFLTAFAERGFALVELQPVTRDSQAQQGLDFTLSAIHESGTVWVQLTVPRKGKLATLSRVQLEVKDAKGQEVLLAPLATTDENGATTGYFRLTPEHAARCNVILVTEESKPPAPYYALNYSVSLNGYVTGAKAK